MSNGSQQATKAAPKHTHNDRRLSECQNKQVLRRPIFSIGQYDNNTHNPFMVEFAPLPHIINESTNRASGEGNPIPLGTSFGWSGRRQPPSSNLTIS